MKILVANDDGIFADGIKALALALQSLGEVTVVAPNQQRSGAGHSCTLGVPFKTEKVDFAPGITGYAIWGTPRDCVELAIESDLIDFKPDLIVTGINKGLNVVADAVCSGTCGSASVGLLYGIPAIAMSLDWGDNWDYSYAAKVAVEVAKWLVKQPDNDKYVLSVNVPNIPEKDIKGFKACGFGGFHQYKQVFKKYTEGPYTYYENVGTEVKKFDTLDTLDGDLYALEHGYITLTPIHIDVVKYEYLKAIADLEKNNLPK